MHYVYILKSLSVDRYYVGETKDINARIELHNDTTRGRYTSKNGPWEIKSVIEVESRSEGRRIESYIKKRKSKAYVSRLIQKDSAVTELIERVLNSSVS